MSAARSKGSVGIVGLGIMGGAIGRNLVSAGWQVFGFDIDAARQKEAAAAGITTVNSAAAVAKKASTILTSLPKPDALDMTAHGIAAAKLPRRVVIEVS